VAPKLIKLHLLQVSTRTTPFRGIHPPKTRACTSSTLERRAGQWRGPAEDGDSKEYEEALEDAVNKLDE